MIIGPLDRSKKNESHPIERVMDNAFTKMRALADADVVMGNPVYTADGASIIPLSRVTMGFLTGGGEYGAAEESGNEEYPFAGGSGAGVSVNPVGFLVSDGKTVKLINMDEKSPIDKLLGLIPETFGKVAEGGIAASKLSRKRCKKDK